MDKYYSRISVSVIIFMIMAGFPLSIQAHGAKEGFIGPEQLNERLGKVKLLDIRSEKEYEQAHIPTALVIPLKEISEARLTQLGFQTEEELVIYAESDLPAQKAKVLLEAIGFTSVKVLSGGFVHWVEDRFKTVAGKMSVPAGTSRQTVKTSLTLQPAQYDFGIIRQEAGVVETTFTLTNTGDEQVTIEEIAASCGCTSAKMEETVIQPGKTVELKVFFDPNFHKEPEGRFSRTVFLQTSEGVEVQAKIYVEIQE